MIYKYHFCKFYCFFKAAVIILLSIPSRIKLTYYLCYIIVTSRIVRLIKWLYKFFIKPCRFFFADTRRSELSPQKTESRIRTSVFSVLLIFLVMIKFASANIIYDTVKVFRNFKSPFHLNIRYYHFKKCCCKNII